MKVLFLEDNEPIAVAVRDGLSDEGIDTDIADTISKAMNTLSDIDYDLILVDANSESGHAMDIIDKVAVVKEQSFFFKPRDPVQIPVVVIRHSGQTVPSDTSVIRGTVEYPFSTKTLVDTIRAVFPGDRVPGPAKESPVNVLEEMNISPGEGYIVLSDKSNAIRKVVKSFSDSGSDVLLFTSSPAKVAKERMGLDLHVEVIPFTGQEYALGTNLMSFNDFVGSKPSPVVVVDDLCNVIEHCGLDRTMRFLSEIMASKADHKFTFLTTASWSEIGQGAVNVISRVLKPCYFED